MQRPHPLYLYYDTKKWLLLLLLPIIRALFFNRDAVSVILSSLRDTTLAAILVTYSVIKWRRARYALRGGLTYEHGLILRRWIRVMAEDAASIEVERSPLMWLARGRRIRINTAGLRRRADATIYLPEREAEIMVSMRNRNRERHVASVFSGFDFIGIQLKRGARPFDTRPAAAGGSDIGQRFQARYTDL